MDDYAQYFKVKTSTVYWPGTTGVSASDLNIGSQEVKADQMFWEKVIGADYSNPVM